MARLIKDEWNCGRGWVASLRGEMEKYGVSSDFFNEEDFKEILKKVRSEQRKKWKTRRAWVYKCVCKKKLDKER